MPDRPDHDALNHAAPINTLPELEAARLRFAAARVRALTTIELGLLELAVGAPDDDSARRLELCADTVWRDALAVNGEHYPDLSNWHAL